MKNVILIVLALTLAGCLEPEPTATPMLAAQGLVDSMVYVKAKNGLCYGVVSVHRMSSNGSVAENQMIVKVDCAEVNISNK